MVHFINAHLMFCGAQMLIHPFPPSRARIFFLLNLFLNNTLFFSIMLFAAHISLVTSLGNHGLQIPIQLYYRLHPRPAHPQGGFNPDSAILAKRQQGSCQAGQLLRSADHHGYSSGVASYFSVLQVIDRRAE